MQSKAAATSPRTMPPTATGQPAAKSPRTKPPTPSRQPTDRMMTRKKKTPPSPKAKANGGKKTAGRATKKVTDYRVSFCKQRDHHFRVNRDTDAAQKIKARFIASLTGVSDSNLGPWNATAPRTAQDTTAFRRGRLPPCFALRRALNVYGKYAATQKKWPRPPMSAS